MTRGRLGALGAPGGLTVTPGTLLGEAVVAWVKGVAIHGFLVQHASDPNTAATISAPIPATKAKLNLTLTQGVSVSCRVAAIDPASSTGMSPWSAWVVGNAR